MAAVWRPTRPGCTTTARLQLALAGLLAALLLVAVVSALPESRADHWTPFAPHGWAAIGTAASLLMLSFIGWEAVSHLAGELRDPARQLPRAIFAALGIVVVLYLGLAVATVGVLGTAAPSEVPLADLMARRARRARPHRHRGARRAAHDGRDERVRSRRRQAGRRARRRGLRARRVRRPAPGDPAVRGGRRHAARAARGRAARRRRPDPRLQRPFVAVYVLATAAGTRILAGGARVAAAIAFAAVTAVFAFSGLFLLVPAVIAVLVLASSQTRILNWSTATIAVVVPSRRTAKAAPNR